MSLLLLLLLFETNLHKMSVQCYLVTWHIKAKQKHTHTETQRYTHMSCWPWSGQVAINCLLMTPLKADQKQRLQFDFVFMAH